jgi:hypothetical protein
MLTKIISLLSFLSLLISSVPAHSAVFNISSGDVAGLIAAINTANGNGEENTIILEAGTYTLTAVHNTDGLANGLPVISSAVTFHGMGAELTTLARDPAAPRFRILSVAAGGTLILNGLTIRGGNELSGAGVRNAGTVIITNSTVAGNSDEAILSFGDMTINSSTIADNSGVGISNGGVMTITNSTIAGNSDNGIGNGGNLMINNSAITGNAKHCREFFASCAGIDNFEAFLTINNSTIAANGVGNPIGAGIQSGHGRVHINNSTIVRNSGRGGVGFHGAVVSGPTTLQNSLLALNTNVSTGLSSDCFFTGLADVLSLGNNLIGDPTHCGFTASDRQGDPGLGEFIDDGAPGHGRVPLLSGSQAIDAGNEAACAATDQLDTPRRGACDIGAVEFYPVVNNLVVVSNISSAFDPEAVPGGPAGTLRITAEFTNTSAQMIGHLLSEVIELAEGNLLLNADRGAGGVGARLTIPDSGNTPLLPGATETFEFIIGLQKQEAFTFFVNMLGDPQTSNTF